MKHFRLLKILKTKIKTSPKADPKTVVDTRAKAFCLSNLLRSNRTKLGILIVFGFTFIFTIAGLINTSFQKATAYGQYEFVTRWTDLPAGEFEIELHGGDNKFFIDWGDGNGYGSTPQWNVNKISHNYATAGTRDIKIKLINNESWRFKGWTLYNNPKAQYLTEVLNWGDIEFFYMERMFYRAVNLKRLPNRAPNTSKVVSMQEMFWNARRLNHDLSQFDFSGLYNLNGINGPLVGFASITSLSTENNDKLIKKWRAQLADHVPQWPSSNRLTYCTARAEREFLQNKGWKFADEQDCRQPFVTRWTNLPAGELKIKLNGPKSTLKINWGDGTIETKTDVREISHTYSQKDTYDISIFANVSEFYGWTLENNPKAKYLTSVEQWGSVNFKDMSYMFADAIGLTSIPSTGIDSLWVRNMSHMFARARSFNQPVNFRTDNVTDMSGMFMGATAFNQPVNFRTDNVTDMSGMFMLTTAFNQPINFTDTSKVTDMGSMFSSATAFNQPLNFNTENVTDMSSMFMRARSFNQPVNFNTSNSNRMSNMFDEANAFNQDLSEFDFSKVYYIELGNFVSNSNLSVGNYDKLIKKWHTQLKDKTTRYYPLSTGLKYCTAETEHDYLKNVKDWSFKDTRDCSGLNLPPADITLSTDQVDENNAPNFELADITITNASDDIPGDTNTPSLTCETAGADDASFQITGNKLIFKPVADFETKNSYALCIRATDAGGLTKDKNFTINVRDLNDAPTIANQAFSIAENSANGTEVGQIVATDPDAGQTLTYEIISGNDLNIFEVTNDGKLKVANNTNLDYEQHQSVTLKVKVTDNGTPALNAQANITINITDVNEAPTISGAPELTANTGVAYSFTPTATDPDTTAPNNTLTFEIENKPSWLNFDASNGTLSGTPGYSDVGTYNNIKLRAKDGGTPALSAELPEFNIIVNSVNRAPVITSTPVLTTIKGEQYSYTITATDEDNDPLTLTATLKPTWLNFDASTGVLSGTPGNNEAGNDYPVTLTVSDGTVTVEQSFTIHVNDKNYTPTISDQTFSIAENTANNTEVGQIVATDPDAGQTLTYEIISGNDLGIFALANDGKLTVANNTNLDYEQHQSVTLRVKVTDNGTPALHAEADITINITDVNEAPVWTSVDTITMNEKETLEHTLTATDEDGDSLTYSVDNLPSWITLSNDKLTLTPQETEIGIHTITTKVSDGSTTIARTLTITVNNINDAPIITSVAPTNAIKGERYNYTITATDEDNDPLTYSATVKPDWLSFDTNSHILSGTPGNAEVNQDYTVTLTVSDGTATATQTFTIHVNDKNYAPIISDQTFSVAENTANNTEVGQIVATDPDENQTLTYEILSGNDLGIFELTTEGKLKIQNNTNLDYEKYQSVILRVKVTDSSSPALSAEANVTINITDINEAPVWTSADQLTIDEDSTVEHNLTATDPENATLIYSVDGSLPSWITLLNDKLTLQPTQSEVGSHNLLLKVSDGTNETPQTLQITVNNINDAPIITSVAPTNATKGEQYSYTITATDEDNDPLIYSATIKPDWLTFDTDTHVLSGTPSNSEAGQTYQITLTVSDGTATATQTFNLTVNDKNYAPIISDQTFSIAENSANNTEVGQVVASDPDNGQTLTYEIISGNDLGIFALANDGKLTVANNTNLDYEQHQSITLKIKVTDNGSPTLSAEANITINITNVNEAPVWTSVDTITMNEKETYYHNLTAIDPENNSLIYSATSLPTWIVLNGNQLTLTPTQTQVQNIPHQIILKVSDGTNETPQTLQITVNNINDAPIITSVAPTNAIKNQLYSYTITATDEDNDPLTYSATVKPDWLSFDTNSHILSGTPGNSEAGQTYQITLTVSDGTATATQTFTIHVNDENHAPTILNQSFFVIENTVNGTEIAQVIANDPDPGQTLTYQILSGNDLNIFEITPDGKLKVKNNTNLDYEKYQSVILRVKVTDNGSPTLSAEANITINITDIDDEAPTITVNTTPIILTVGDSFSVPTATCHDNQSNCTLTINNQVNTAVAGNYQIIYTATDEAGNQAITVISVIVKNPHIPHPPSPKPPKPPLPINPSTPLPPFNILTPTDPNNSITNTLPNANHNEESNPNHANDVFILKGEPEITLTVGESYSEPGIICLSDADCSIKITGHVDTNTPGVYILTYHGTTHDENPKSAILTRKITVKPATSSITHTWDNFNWWWLLILILILILITALTSYYYHRKNSNRQKRP